MTSFHGSLGIFLWSYLSGTSSLKLGLCVLGTWVCLCRWDRGLSYKSQWQYQVKKSLQGLLALPPGNTTPAFRDIVWDTEHKQEKAWLSTSPIGWFNALFLFTTKCLFSWLSNLRIFVQVKFRSLRFLQTPCGWSHNCLSQSLVHGVAAWLLIMGLGNRCLTWSGSSSLFNTSWSISRLK